MTAETYDNSTITIRQADWSRDADVNAVVHMIDDYASDAMGSGQRLSAAVREALPGGLRDTPGCVAFLVEDAGQPVGVAVCFTSFSTFAGKPKLNIHDFSINPSHRRRGLGKALMQRVLEYADAMGCGKVTLEVRADNQAAQRLYRDAGFGPSDPPYEFWTRYPADT